MPGAPYCVHCNARHVAGKDCISIDGVRVNTWALKDALEAAHGLRARWWRDEKEDPPLEQIVRTSLAKYLAALATPST